tara:strand:+ start:2744 stop:3643 length:900 start_codon:yes stop_codon:yes gene_type:complete
MKPLRVLFAVDFKEGSEHAAKEILDLARTRPIDLTLIHVYNQKLFEERDLLYAKAALKYDEVVSKIRVDVETKLSEWAKRIFVSHPYKVKVEFGIPARIFENESPGYDALVTGANRHGIWDHIFLNSVAESILGRSFIPTLIFRKKFSGWSEATVLVDLGEDVESVVGKAFSFAADMSLKKLNFISYYPMPIEVAAYGYGMNSIVSDKDTQELMQALKQGLNKIIEKNNSQKIDFSVEVGKVSASSIASEIADKMHSHEAPIIVGRRRRSGVSEFFLGSVTQSLLRTCSSDLIILPIAD